MSQFDLTDDQLQIQEMARKFTADAITPFAAEWDEKHIFPRDTIREAAELGFGAIYVSEESGGLRPRPAERPRIDVSLAQRVSPVNYLYLIPNDGGRSSCVSRLRQR